ncbi:MAG: type III secretion system export apparatus subunit SctS [Thermoguttaceae bacterium]|nr:type III secretion system export apparatus subunit SctS [Thermoguttaceae bacterium]
MDELIVELSRESLRVALLVGAPALLVGAIVGLLVAIVQAATQIQDQTLAFVVKLVSVLAALAIFLPWCMSRLAEFTARLIENAPETLSGVL